MLARCIHADFVLVQSLVVFVLLFGCLVTVSPFQEGLDDGFSVLEDFSDGFEV